MIYYRQYRKLNLYITKKCCYYYYYFNFLYSFFISCILKLHSGIYCQISDFDFINPNYLSLSVYSLNFYSTNSKNEYSHENKKIYRHDLKKGMPKKESARHPY